MSAPPGRPTTRKPLPGAAQRRIDVTPSPGDGAGSSVQSVRRKLAILLWATTPERPELCATPFFHATIAAALDCEVEVHFSGRAARLLIAGEAQGLFAIPGGDKPVYSFMREAANLGVRFVGCRLALREHTREGEAYIPEYAGDASATDFVLRVLDPEWATLVF